jgi:hypothetical protein
VFVLETVGRLIGMGKDLAHYPAVSSIFWLKMQVLGIFVNCTDRAGPTERVCREKWT